MTITWFGWVFTITVVLNVLLSIAQIDKPRGPLDPFAAVIIAMIDGLLLWGALTVGTIR